MVAGLVSIHAGKVAAAAIVSRVVASGKYSPDPAALSFSVIKPQCD
jgi:hypothetical protein